ncbi:HNH endonuclease [Nocardia sp. NPDC050799]|uniref:HNH endonuclease n=1 Tax=Nocardia sp. NPDC050799 TaxID=3154842 RepID=UPI0033CE92F2
MPTIAVAEPATLTPDNWIHTRVLVLNASYEALARIPADRAVVLLTGGIAESVVIRQPYFPIRSQHTEIMLPETIRLVRYRYLAHLAVRRPEGSATHAAILRRDGNRCGYCGADAHTVDHIRPRSRGGPNTWENLIACCVTCNTGKADRTPEEAGMRLLWQPRPPDPLARAQRRIWRQLATTTTTEAIHERRGSR